MARPISGSDPLDCSGLFARAKELRRAIGLSVAGLVLGACGGTATGRVGPPPEEPASARRSDQLEMRKPDDGRAPSEARALGTLAPTEVSLDAQRPPRTDRRDDAAQVAAAPSIRLGSAPRPQPYALREGELVTPGGLVVHRVPKGISVRSGRDEQTDDLVWEIVDARGRRLALLKERSFRRAAASSTPVLAETLTSRSEGRRDDWARAPVRVVIDRFRSESHIYTLERLARGTDWIWGGLELAKPSEMGDPAP